MTILVTGATGNVGRNMVEQLVRAGQHVRALTRDPAAARLPEGAEAVAGDLNDPPSLARALDGVTGLHLITIGGAGGETLGTAPEIMELAARAGVRKCTVLWSGTEGPVEEAVEKSGLEWTMLQPVEFMSNMRGWIESVRDEGVVREPYGAERSALVHEADIAAVAVAALTGDGHAGRRYVVTGPEVLTVPGKVRALSEALGRELQFIELDEAQARENMRAAGATDEVIDFVLGWHADPPPMAYTVLPTVEEVTGRPARTIAQWAEENAELFRS
ncbi:NAD-dependent epimerase/dehydratase family protein [Streptomyces armeniacus]|uniref:NAD-dependent epimerase/dehydratase family protein n=1 Tax=Streptomyces armeniacus TaxID=83291 RepID=A0A345XR13_9ACTN|nr:NAD(P)H-binding protein [Streptomyces armeniacus]AXK34079.1 NAD-dependent epimerase/dehydratase family protein [Streptomyces armeniacus]